MKVWSDMMEVLTITSTELIFYSVLFICLILIAIIIVKLRKLKEEDKKEVVVTKINDKKEEVSGLEEVLKQMQESVDNNKEATKKATELFEEEQEEKAIISYQELVRANLKNKMPERARVEVAPEPKPEVKPTTQKPIEETPSFEIKDETPSFEIKEEFKDEIIDVPKHDDLEALDLIEEEQPKKFKNTDFISPIYGTMQTNQVNQNNNEQKNNDEFLNSLKQFRDNL